MVVSTATVALRWATLASSQANRARAQVLRVERQEALHSQEPGIYARLVFSAKETTYKALYPMLKRILEFSDVHIETKVADGLFLASLTQIVGSQTDLPANAQLVGRLVMDDELIVTAMALSRDGLPLSQEGLSLGNVPC